MQRREEQERKAGDRMVLIIKDEKCLFPWEVEYPFRWCPAGTFMMGSPTSEIDRFNNEVQHQVTLTHGVWMLETPVTQAMWTIVMGKNPSYFRGNGKLPVECVSWYDCQEYIEKLNDHGIAPNGYRFSLPTEAQWEYACRAGTTAPFNFRTTLENGDKANCCGQYYFYDTYAKVKDVVVVHPEYFYIEPPDEISEKNKPEAPPEKTTEVGSYLANAWGLYDMHGNVGEWCLDCYGDYPSDSVTDPVAVSSDHNAYRVFRGGSYFDAAECCRSASRDGDMFCPWEPDAFNGLRLSLIHAKSKQQLQERRDE